MSVNLQSIVEYNIFPVCVCPAQPDKISVDILHSVDTRHILLA